MAAYDQLGTIRPEQLLTILKCALGDLEMVRINAVLDYLKAGLKPNNIAAGLTLSFVAISLGAAFGLLSGRGAFAGIISAGIIAFITALLGGTRIQTSGPTAPMTAVTAIVVAFAHDGLLAKAPGANPEHFVNLVLLLTGTLLFAMALIPIPIPCRSPETRELSIRSNPETGKPYRVGDFIELVPRVVVSGFMNGIAILIWVDQLKKLFGIGGKQAFGGEMRLNITVALGTLAAVFLLPLLVKRYLHKSLHFLPGALLAILVVSAITNLTGLNIGYVSLAGIDSVDALLEMVWANIPTDWSPGLLGLALWPALQLAALCYLDTLLTSLVVDEKASKLFGKVQKTHRSKELGAQGLANIAVVPFGGIPGAQATIRSVLILNENATHRLAGVLVGFFVLVETFLFQDLVTLIPEAVFAGILFKVGYDVMDWEPIVGYSRPAFDTIRRLFGKPLAVNATIETDAPHPRGPGPSNPVTHGQVAFIAGTTLVTVLVDLNIAVFSFLALFYLLSFIKAPIQDLPESLQDTALGDEA